MRIVATTAVLLLGPLLAACGDRCRADEERFTLEDELSAGQVLNLLELEGVSDPAQLTCTQACETTYGWAREGDWVVVELSTCDWAVSTEAFEDAMGGDSGGEVDYDVPVGNLLCTGWGASDACALE